MSASAPARPQLKGHHMAYMKRHLYIGIGLSIVSGIVWKLAICDPRQKAYAEFYKNYDADAHLKRIAKAGLLRSALPEDLE